MGENGEDRSIGIPIVLSKDEWTKSTEEVKTIIRKKVEEIAIPAVLDLIEQTKTEKIEV